MATNKDLQTKRMMRYFIEAANKIIDTEGVDNITARKVADSAGYNVATLYNYFHNLSHLIFFASLRTLEDYAIALPEYTKNVTNPVELYIKIWECFNYYAFLNPDEYRLIFFGDYSRHYNDSLKLYYDIFPEKIPKEGLRFFPMLSESNLTKRDYVTLESVAEKGFISYDDIDDISHINTYIFEGTLHKFITSEEKPSPMEEAKIATRYQAHTLIGYGVPKEIVEKFI